MPWVRFDDQFPINRKVSRLSDAAYRLHSSAIFWCGRNLTDGVVPEEDLEDVCARVRTPQRFVTEMLARGLWHELGAECDSEDCPAHPDNGVTNAVTNAVASGVKGWVIHDYLEYQPSKERVMREREGNAARQKKWRDQQKRKRNGVTSRNNGVSNADSNAVSNGAPSRPVPKGRTPVGENVQEISQSARVREATRWLHTAYGLTDSESARVIEVAEARAPKPVKALVPYLRGMAEQGDLAAIITTVQNPTPAAPPLVPDGPGCSRHPEGAIDPAPPPGWGDCLICNTRRKRADPGPRRNLREPA